MYTVKCAKTWISILTQIFSLSVLKHGFLYFLFPPFFLVMHTDQALGAVSFPPPYLAPNSSSNAILGGINYASGASGILDQTGTLFVRSYNFTSLIHFFLPVLDNL